MSQVPTRPAVDVAIVNWNTAEAALKAAGAYLASESIEPSVTIIDNHSDEKQREALRSNAPGEVRLELLEENVGYGTAANRALRNGSAELVCVSNADVSPAPAALAALSAVALTETQAGMVGPAFGEETDHYHAKLPSGGTMLGRIFAGSFARGAVAPPEPDEVKAVDQPSGACFVVRREVFERIGGFDEGFFLWYEDVDLARRLLDAGARNLIVGSAQVGHAGGASFALLDSASQQAIRLSSVERYIRKHHSSLAPVAAPLLAVSRTLRARGRRGYDVADGT